MEPTEPEAFESLATQPIDIPNPLDGASRPPGDEGSDVLQRSLDRP